MTKFVFLPPYNAYTKELRDQFAKQISDSFPDLLVETPENDEDVLESIKDADAAMGWIAPEALKIAQKIKWLHNPDAGPFEGYYYDELVKHPLIMTNPRGIYSDHIANHIMMYILSLSRGLPWYERNREKKIWDKEARQTPYVVLDESTVLINGVGGIGYETARLCSAFGMKVIGIDPRPEHEEAPFDVYSPEKLDNYIGKADFVINTAPHTPDTDRIFRSDRFNLMKNSAYFINVGRGKVCSLDDLCEALEQKKIAGAGLDVYEIEPLPENHKLWDLDNVILTPHVAVKGVENINERRYQILSTNINNFIKGDTLMNIVDKEKWY